MLDVPFVGAPPLSGVPPFGAAVSGAAVPGAPLSGAAMSDRRISSFVAALELGLRLHFRGRIDHLRATVRQGAAGAPGRGLNAGRYGCGVLDGGAAKWCFLGDVGGARALNGTSGLTVGKAPPQRPEPVPATTALGGPVAPVGGVHGPGKDDAALTARIA